MTDLDQYAGLDFKTPEDAHEWLDSQRHLSDREKRRVAAWIGRWETRIGQEYIDRLNTRAAQIKDEHEANQSAIDDARRRTVEVEHLMSSGRIPEKDGRTEITRLRGEHRERLKIQDSLHKAVERWEADSETTPSDHLRVMQERFKVGAPQYGVETLTMAVLEGKDGA